MTSKKILAAVIILVGILGTIFFKYSNVIPYSFILFWVFLGISFLGFFFWYSAPSKQDSFLLSEINEMKESGRVIPVDYQSLTITHSYQHQSHYKNGDLFWGDLKHHFPNTLELNNTTMPTKK